MPLLFRNVSIVVVGVSDTRPFSSSADSPSASREGFGDKETELVTEADAEVVADAATGEVGVIGVTAGAGLDVGIEVEIGGKTEIG